MNKYNLKLFNKQYLALFVDSYIDLHKRKHEDLTFEKFAKTELWKNVEFKLQPQTKVIFEKKWNELVEEEKKCSQK